MHDLRGCLRQIVSPIKNQRVGIPPRVTWVWPRTRVKPPAFLLYFVQKPFPHQRSHGLALESRILLGEGTSELRNDQVPELEAMGLFMLGQASVIACLAIAIHRLCNQYLQRRVWTFSSMISCVIDLPKRQTKHMEIDMVASQRRDCLMNGR